MKTLSPEFTKISLIRGLTVRGRTAWLELPVDAHPSREQEKWHLLMWPIPSPVVRDTSDSTSFGVAFCLEGILISSAFESRFGFSSLWVQSLCKCYLMLLFTQELWLNSSICIPSHLLEKFLPLQNKSSQILQKKKPRTETEINPVTLSGRRTRTKPGCPLPSLQPWPGSTFRAPLAEDKIPAGIVICWYLGSHPSCCVRGEVELAKDLSWTLLICLNKCKSLGLGSDLGDSPALRGDTPSMPGCRRALWKGPAPFLAWGQAPSPAPECPFSLVTHIKFSVFPALKLPFPAGNLCSLASCSSSSTPVISDTFPGASSRFEIPQEREIHIWWGFWVAPLLPLFCPVWHSHTEGKLCFVISWGPPVFAALRIISQQLISPRVGKGKQTERNNLKCTEDCCSLLTQNCCIPKSFGLEGTLKSSPALGRDTFTRAGCSKPGVSSSLWSLWNLPIYLGLILLSVLKPGWNICFLPECVKCTRILSGR